MKRRTLQTITADTYAQARESFLLRCRAKNLSPRTIKWYTDIIGYFEQFLQAHDAPTRPSDIGKSTIRLYLDHDLKRGINPCTVNGRLRALKVFFTFLEKNHGLENPTSDIDKISEKKTVIRTFSPQQMKDILDRPNRNNFSGLRDYIVMMMFFDTGIRLSECLGIKVEHVNLQAGCILVTGKGNKERIVPLGSKVQRELQGYIAAARLEDGMYLFCSVNDNTLEKRVLQNRIKEYGKRAGITGIRCSPHTFRHTFAKQYLLNGGNIFELQKILGHSTLEMVRKYVNLLDVDIQARHKRHSPVDNL